MLRGGRGRPRAAGRLLRLSLLPHLHSLRARPILITASFLFFLFCFLAIGVASVTRSKGTDRDYLLADREMAPWLVALSATATGNSGYMFIGQIGYTYLVGLSSVWLMVGWTGGDLLVSFLVHPRLRRVSGAREILSYGGVVSGWHGTRFVRLRFLTGVVTLVLLGTYAAAQFKAGSKALQVLFGWDASVGAIIGCAIVVVYCLAGGIRASVWTDAAQSCVMIVAMSLLLFIAVQSAGGPASLYAQLSAVSPDYMSLFSAEVIAQGRFGPVLFALGWLCAGIGVVGQPHIMVRFMTLDNPLHLSRVRWYYYTWATLFFLCAIGVGLAARALLPDLASFDPELALPTLAMDHLPPVLIGLILAGLFAATMSTADSQILSCSAAVTQDILPERWRSPVATKLATVGAATIALGVALWGGADVFTLVVVAWSILAAGFAPLLIVYSLGWAVSETVALAMVMGGIAVTLAWRELGLSVYILEIAPGMLAGLVILAVGSLLGGAGRPRFDRSAPAPGEDAPATAPRAP